jgi:hypothetical protein
MAITIIEPASKCFISTPFLRHITSSYAAPPNHQREAKTEIITDYEVHDAARSDIGKALCIVEPLETAGLKPDTLFADKGYPSVPSA